MFSVAYFCDVHHTEIDTPIADDCVIRRVRIQADIMLTGTSLDPNISQAEAVGRLERAVAAAGGVLGVACVSSAIGRIDRGAVESRKSAV